MGRRGLEKVVDTLRRVSAGPDASTDAELLERFLIDRDEGAFEGLVRRHGPMVLGVCRRVLKHTQDAEDAFQATFLVLVRKASSIAPRELVGNWLYGVAHQTARKALGIRARRGEREVAVPQPPEVAVSTVGLDADVAPMLDREISCLPDIYRAPLVLIDLEGRTRKEAALALGWREGTVAGRLARARKLLADRLTRRGLSAPALFTPAVLPPVLTTSTLNAAAAVASGEAIASAASATVAALTEGVLPTMSYFPLKMAAALIVVAGFFGAAVGAGTRFGAAQAPAPPAATPPAQEEALRMTLKVFPVEDLVIPVPPLGQSQEADYQRARSSLSQIIQQYSLEYSRDRAARFRALLQEARDEEARRANLEKAAQFLKALQEVEQNQAEADQRRKFYEQLYRAQIAAAERALADEEYKQQIAAARKLLARHDAVTSAVESITKAIQKVREATTDKQAEIEALDAIIKAAQEMKARAEKQAPPKKP
jgi:RNA polymerase sigma factor (sigma-70 family)